MVFVKMGGSPSVGPRVGLVTATDVFLFDGNPPGGACGRVSDAAWRLTSGNLAKEILLFILFYDLFSC